MLGKSNYPSIALQGVYNIFESHRKQSLFEGLPSPDKELGEGSPPPLWKCKHPAHSHVICSPLDADSLTEVRLDETDANKHDYDNTFQPQFEDGYNNEGANHAVPSPQSHSQTQPLDAITMASIQTLCEVRITTNKWVSKLAPLEDWKICLASSSSIMTLHARGVPTAQHRRRWTHS